MRTWHGILLGRLHLSQLFFLKHNSISGPHSDRMSCTVHSLLIWATGPYRPDHWRTPATHVWIIQNPVGIFVISRMTLQWSSLWVINRGQAYRADHYQAATTWTTFICTGEADQAKDRNTQLMDTGQLKCWALTWSKLANSVFVWFLTAMMVNSSCFTTSLLIQISQQQLPLGKVMLWLLWLSFWRRIQHGTKTEQPKNMNPYIHSRWEQLSCLVPGVGQVMPRSTWTLYLRNYWGA